MPKIFTTDEIVALRITAEAHMLDTGQRLIYLADRDRFGDMASEYEEGDYTHCGLDMDIGNEAHGSNMTTITWDAVCRIPVDFDIEPEDRFMITEFRGEEAEMVFEVVAPVRWGIANKRISLRRVEP